MNYKNVLQNPFDIVKATDFDDAQINEYWVDMPSEGGFENIIKPTLAMPMLIIGGKGSGKTHLLRYFSYPIQKLRFSGNIFNKVIESKYIGVYVRCTGLNAQRFSKPSVLADWDGIFSYYFDIWISQVLLDNIIDLLEKSNVSMDEKAICSDILDLFDKSKPFKAKTLVEVVAGLRGLQKEIDYKVNNCVMSSKLEMNILVSPGRLVFGIPKVLRKYIPYFKNTLFVYLIDELENFDKNQQKYIQTLIREKEAPSTIKVGVRSYGIKTRETLSGGEVNKEGSEFDIVRLDSILRKNKKYPEFASKLCIHRLKEQGLMQGQNEINSIEAFFESYSLDEYVSGKAFKVDSLQSVRKNLVDAVSKGLAPGIHTEQDVGFVLDNISDENPLAEKAKIYRLYQEWIGNKNRLSDPELYQKISGSCEKVLSYFKNDFFIQLNKNNKDVIYSGFDSIVKISEGFPRLLLTTLKYVYAASIFNGEKPFTEGQISMGSQYEGIKDTSDWFFEDARMEGIDGISVKRAIHNLAEIFRINRYGDKPVECSLISFNCDLDKLTSEVQEKIRDACDWALLINVTDGSRDKNSIRVIQKYKLNSMLSARWDLPVNSRGSLKMTARDVEAVFGSDDEYAEYKKAFEKRVNYPFNLPGVGHPAQGKMDLKSDD